MIDFSPLLKDPSMIFFGAAAQFGIFATFLVSMLLIPVVFPGIAGDESLVMRLASAIGIIGAADGPTTLYVANHFDLKEYMAPISVAAYSYMALVPVIQPPIIRALTTKKERTIRMTYTEHPASRLTLILFPIIVHHPRGHHRTHERAAGRQPDVWEPPARVQGSGAAFQRPRRTSWQTS